MHTHTHLSTRPRNTSTEITTEHTEANSVIKSKAVVRSLKHAFGTSKTSRTQLKHLEAGVTVSLSYRISGHCENSKTEVDVIKTFLLYEI